MRRSINKDKSFGKNILDSKQNLKPIFAFCPGSWLFLGETKDLHPSENEPKVKDHARKTFSTASRSKVCKNFLRGIQYFSWMLFLSTVFSFTFCPKTDLGISILTFSKQISFLNQESLAAKLRRISSNVVALGLLQV